jgi:hypothetical protein
MVTFGFTAVGGHLDCLKYMAENGCTPNKLAFTAAIMGDSRACLEYLHKAGLEWDDNMCERAAYSGKNTKRKSPTLSLSSLSLSLLPLLPLLPLLFLLLPLTHHLIILQRELRLFEILIGKRMRNEIHRTPSSPKWPFAHFTIR